MGDGYKNRGSNAAGLGFKNRGAKLLDGAAYANRGATDGTHETFKNRGQAWGTGVFYNRSVSDFASLSILGSAAFFAPLKSTLVLTRGSGDPTYSRATVAWEFDNEGKLITVPSGGARFGGGRMVYNQINAPTEDFTSATWVKTGGGGVTVSGNATTAPDGTLTANKIIPNSGTAQHYVSVSNRGTWPVGSTIANSVYAKYAGLRYLIIYNASAPSAGAVWFDLVNGAVGGSQNGCAGTITSIGDGWYRCTATGVASSIVTSVEYHACTTDGSFTGVGNGSDGIYLWGPQLENVSGQADQTASEYVSVGVLSAPYHGAGVDGVKWFDTNKNGSAISESSLLGYHAEGARTNSLLYSRDLTNAAWAATNITPAKTATGIDNVANSASTLTAGASDATILQTLSLAAAARSSSAYVKRRTGSGNIYMTRDGGTNWTDITASVGASWTRVKIENTSVLNPSIGFKIATSGDAIDVDCVQDEAGAFISSPIITTTASVTRNADDLSYSIANLSLTAGSILASYAVNQSVSYNKSIVTGRKTANGYVDFISLFDGTSFKRPALGVNVSSVSQANITPNDGALPLKGAVRYATDNFAVCINGGVITADTSGTLPASLDKIAIGYDSSSVAHDAYIKSVYIWPTALTDAQLKQVSA